VVAATFNELSLELAADCSYDSVTLYDGSSINSQKLDTFCSNAVSTITSSGSSMLVVFQTDHSIHTGRFSLSWTFEGLFMSIRIFHLRYWSNPKYFPITVTFIFCVCVCRYQRTPSKWRDLRQTGCRTLGYDDAHRRRRRSTRALLALAVSHKSDTDRRTRIFSMRRQCYQRQIHTHSSSLLVS